MDEPDGRLLGGRYRLQSPLGRGGMGTVWAAHDELLQRDVAVKEVRLPPNLTEEQRAELTGRTMREARAAARISTDAAVAIYDVVSEDDRPWIVMQRLPPRTLEDELRERGRLPAEEAAAIGLRLLEALQAAHGAGVLHRDVKPSNVMLAPRPVLSDFGIARFTGDATVTSTGMLVGSPAYLPPERARGHSAGPASDLWALGVTLWVCVEGSPPFQREGALETLLAVVTEELPPMRHAGRLAPALLALLQKDPDLRPDIPTARRLLEEVVGEPAQAPEVHPAVPVEPVEPAAPTVALPVPPPGAGTPPGRPARRRRPLLAAGLVAALAVAVAVAVAVAEWGDDGPPAENPAAAPAATAPAPEPTGTTAPQPSGDGQAAVPDPGDAPTSSPAQDAAEPAVVPAGFVRHEDPTGFTVAVPEGWQAEREGPRVYLRDPDSSAYLLVDQTDEPAADPFEDWQQQEEAVSRRLEGYERIRLEPIDFRGWDGADWEFVHGESQGVRVLNRNLVTAADQAYALYWSVPSGQWEQRRETFDTIANSFEPDD